MKEIINIDKTFIIYPGWAEGFIIAYTGCFRVIS